MEKDHVINDRQHRRHAKSRVISHIPFYGNCFLSKIFSFIFSFSLTPIHTPPTPPTRPQAFNPSLINMSAHNKGFWHLLQHVSPLEKKGTELLAQNTHSIQYS